MKYCAGITLYNPKELYVKRIIELSNEYEYIIIYDNTENPTNIKDIFRSYNNIKYYSEGQNNGLAVAYNYFLKNAKKENIDFICILDQDSDFNIKNIKKIKGYIEKTDISRLAIVAPRSWDINAIKREQPTPITNTSWVINSGSFLNVKLLDKNSITYDENYFVDRIDVDFCKEIKKRDLDIIIYNKSLLNQELGYAYNNRPSYPPLRHYYIFRDRLYFNKKHYSPLAFIFLSTAQSFKQLFNIIAFEDSKSEKINACYKGLVDFKHKKFKKRK